MNKMLRLALCALMSSATLYAAEPALLRLSPSPTNEEMGLFLRLAEGNLEEAVVEVPAGVILPLRIRCTGSLLAVEGASPAYQVKVLQTCFFKRSGEGLLFSHDLLEWKEVEQFFTGAIGLSYSQTGVELQFSLEPRNPTPTVELQFSLEPRSLTPAESS